MALTIRWNASLSAMLRIGAIGIVAALWPAYMCQSAQTLPPQEESPTVQALQLLRGAVTSASYFSPEEQADLLLDASNAAVNLDRGDAIQWALKLLNDAQKIAPGHYRAAMQKNALVTLARLDPEKAAELYMQQDDPPVPRLAEDIRAYGTQSLFPALWAKRGVASLDQIRQISNWLGSTGEYPHPAIAIIIKKLNEKNPERANDLFIEAVSYLGRGPDFSGTNRHYVDFLLQTCTIPQPSALRLGIQKGLDAIEHAEEASKNSSKKTTFFYQVNTSKGSFEIHSQSSYLVFRLANIAAAVDPRWPDQIREHFSDLKSFPSLSPSDPVTVSAAASSDPNNGGSAASALGRSLAMQLPSIAQTDPQRAMDEAYKIGDPTERSIAIASILPFYARTNSADGLTWLGRLEKMAEAQPPGEPKLRLLVQLAEDQFALQKEAAGLVTAQHGFDLGAELFAEGMEADPGKMAYTIPGFDPLLELSKTMAENSTVRADGLAQIMRVKNEILKARMEIAFAGGIGQGSSGTISANAAASSTN